MPSEINLASICSGRPGLTSAEATSLVEAAAACLFECGHTPPVTLFWSGRSTDAPSASQPDRRTVTWPIASAQVLRTFSDHIFAVERGASAVAIALAETELGLVVVARSRRLSGFDYWLGREPNSQLFQNAARLEVSGILRGQIRDVGRRADEKVQRLMRYPNSIAALVIVIEFGRPQVRMIWK